MFKKSFSTYNIAQKSTEKEKLQLAIKKIATSLSYNTITHSEQLTNNQILIKNKVLIQIVQN